MRPLVVLPEYGADWTEWRGEWSSDSGKM